ncbi:uncharacterized protein LOC129601203 [Paramacrobiotus metropolitanus]|uniref:uncharacterized protein LOC129601203 n=1 Tax=Paramacrobiotus metropolitanus TaxID=2943436 RepID=UPI002445BACC|nr:uncharacterized protein LOC129601203 [Paramacrobiotus metropolitanus]
MPAKQYLYEKAVALFKENRHVEEAAAAVHRTVLQSIDECTRELREVQLGLNELREAASRALAQTTKPKKSRDLLLTVLRKRTEHRELYRRSVEREPDPLIRKAGQKPAKKKKKVDILDIFQPDTFNMDSDLDDKELGKLMQRHLKSFRKMTTQALCQAPVQSMFARLMSQTDKVKGKLRKTLRPGLFKKGSKNPRREVMQKFIELHETGFKADKVTEYKEALMETIKRMNQWSNGYENGLIGMLDV